MLHTIHDINAARLNAIMPTLRQMEEDPVFLDQQRHRFDSDDPPPPYSSGSTTRPPTPDPFPPAAEDIDIDELLRKPLSNEEIHWIRLETGHYHPYSRYNEDFKREENRIDREWGRRDENYNLLYRGPDLLGRAGEQRLRIMIRHSIKKRWERLGVWNPEWGVPRRVHYGPKDDPVDWNWKWDSAQTVRNRKFNSLPEDVKVASWPSRDEETANERAVRRYLKEKGEWDDALDQQPSETDGPMEIHVDNREFFITTRPWYVWKLEVLEEEVRLARHPDTWDLWHRQRNNVTRRWKEKGDWKDSWGDLPGWKWRHESPSPEPPDLNDIEFTPSEIDALEEIPPPTPRPPSKPSSSYVPDPFWSKVWNGVPSNDPGQPPSSSTQPTPKLQEGSSDDHEGPADAAEHVGEERLQGVFKTDACTTSRIEHQERSSLARSRQRGSVRGKPENSYKQLHQPTVQRVLRSATRRACSKARGEKSSPLSRTTQPSKNAPGALTQPARISKPAPRRSARIAARERQLANLRIPSETVKAVGQEDPVSQSSTQRRQKKRKTTASVTTRRMASPKTT